VSWIELAYNHNDGVLCSVCWNVWLCVYLLFSGYWRLFPQAAKRPGREADYSLSFSAGAKNVWRCTSTLPYVFIAWCWLRQGCFFMALIFRMKMLVARRVVGILPHRHTATQPKKIMTKILSVWKPEVSEKHLAVFHFLTCGLQEHISGPSCA